MMQRPTQEKAQHGAGHEGMPGDPGMGRGMIGQGNMMNRMEQREMGHGMPVMGGPLMMHIVFILMDNNGDGTISLQKFQTTRERIFEAMDSNKDGSLTLDEMHAFVHGSSTSMRAQ
jgi:Ca2+-binding EF-hand superfamily protein